jgi:hypothetical protein
MVSDKVSKEAEIILSLISLLDCYRTAHFLNPKNIEEKITSFSPILSMSEWTMLKKLMDKKTLAMKHVPSLSRALTAIMVMKIVSLSLPVFLFISLLSPTFYRIQFAGLSLSSIVIGLMITNIIFLKKYERSASMIIERYVKDHPERFQLIDLKLKETIERLLRKLSVRKREKKLHLKLYNADYKQLKVIKKPTFYRKQYVMELA